MDGFLKWVRADWDRLLGFGLIATGALLIVLGWFGASDSPHVDQAVSYLISGGVGGLFLLGVGATLLISADLHDEWRKLDRVEDVLRRFGSADHSRGAEVDVDATSYTGLDSRTAGHAPDLDHRSMPVMAVAAAGSGVAPAGVAARLPRRRTMTAGLAMSLALIAAGWRHAATHAELAQAVDGAVLATIGLAVAGVVGAVATMVGKRSVQIRTRWLLAPFDLASMVTARTGTGPASTVNRQPIVVADGLSHYHLMDCPALAGIPAREIERGHVPAGLKPCPLCDVAAPGLGR